VTTQHSRRYGSTHKRIRAAWARRIAAGEPVACARCGRWIAPGTPWHLDHDDRNPGQYLGPSHARCNVQTWNRLSEAQKARSSFSRGWSNVNRRRSRQW